MEIYRVPVRQVDVRAVLDDGRQIEGAMFTALATPSSGSETVLDRLNESGQEFIPIARGRDRFLLNKAGIVFVELPVEAAELDRDGSNAAKKRTVRLSLAGGLALLGQFLIVMPAERSRVLDYLNAAPRFLPLLGDGKVALVHKAFIVSVQALD
jgi:hypothetical protein